MLMNVKPKDFDIVTSATPNEIKKIIDKTFDVGKKFGVIVANVDGHTFEIATFRGESEYKDSRHPEKIYFTNAIDDAKRRDFTINGMFYDPIRKKIIDYVNGEKDMENKIIRFIGNPNDRINEDHLRILRAIRFKNILNFSYDKRTWEAICTNAYRIESVSYERISYELNQMLACANRSNALLDLSKSGILAYILPEIDKMKGVPQPKEFHKEGDVFTHTIMALKSLPDNAPLYLVWAVLLHDVGKVATLTIPKNNENDRIRFNKHAYYSAGIAAKICRRLKFPNTEREIIVWLVKNHMTIGDVEKMNVAKRRRFMLDYRIPALLQLHKADASGIVPKDLSMYKNLIEYYNDAKDFVKRQAASEYNPLLTGKDIISNFNISQGPIIGEILSFVEEAHLNEKIKTKKEAIDYIKNYFKFY